MGRKSTLEVWEDLGILDDNLQTMQSLAYQGVNLSVIAHAVGVDVKTLERLRNPKYKQFDERVFRALRRGREALVADTGKYLMDWVKDKEVPIGLRIQIAQSLNEKHGKFILGLDVEQGSEGQLGESGVSQSTGQRVFVISEDDEDE